MDADLRRPSLHNVFDIPNKVGLREELLSGTGVVSPTRISANLAVLTAGKVATDPMTLLTSDGMRNLLERAAETFEWVLIDTPPVGLLPDAGLLTSVADGAILVVRAGSTRCQLAQHAVEAIGRDRILGVVLNQLTDEMRPSAYKHYGYYE
jgi:capsular exopolysaccharide synthesis family protein